MRLVLTLLARNEADVIDANIAFHLGAGVDFVIATDNRSDDGTTEILKGYAREDYLHLIHEEGEGVQNGLWVTRMAQLAAREFGADWLIHSDADEFYWPRGGNLKDVLAAVPSSYGSVRTFVRTFLLRPDDEDMFAERMIVRLSTSAPIHDPASIFRPGSKIIHRAHPDIVVGDGTHALHSVDLPLLRRFHPIELLHFPFRTVAQTERKFVTAARVWLQNRDADPPHYYAKGYGAIREGRLQDALDSLMVDDQTLEVGLEAGTLVVDTRLRDALRGLGVAGSDRGSRAGPAGRLGSLPAPALDDEVRYGIETAVLEEADIVRLQRRIDQLESRLRSLELDARARRESGGPR